MSLEIDLDDSKIKEFCFSLPNENLANTITEYFKKEREPLTDYVKSHAPKSADFVSIRAWVTGEMGNYYGYELMYQSGENDQRYQIGEKERIYSKDLSSKVKS